jgi:large subunit ribosomal protein L54
MTRPSSTTLPLNYQILKWDTILLTMFQVFDVETDTTKLVSHCCGLNYKLEGEEVPLKPDSEYPDWLWTMNTKRPLPTSDELEYGTLDYFKTLEKEARWRWETLQQHKRFRKLV